ncbi:MAG: molybdopterin-dependent oxidoreductase [Deltaproteobacteria bacterium]|nr:molybdopterin-dependent oxidoreductase [Deltaproteobacteria bacterium]
METVTACTLDCPDSCSLLVRRSSTGALHIRGNPRHPVTAGFTCAKIKRYLRRLTSPSRILTPLLRQGSGHRPISWQHALDLCAEHLQELRQQPQSILHVYGFGDKGLLSLASKFFFNRLGASSVRGSLCDDAGIAAWLADFGSLDSNDVTDLVNAHSIVNWGKDLSRSSIHLAALVRRARQRGARVLTISPGGDGNRVFSDFMVRLRPGTDRFLAAAVIRLLFDRQKIGQRLPSRSRNWQLFRSLILQQSAAQLAACCGVELQDVEQVYSFYQNSEPTATLLGWGLQRHRFGGENVRFINALAFLSGNIGISGGGSYFNISSSRNFNLDFLTSATDSSPRTLLLPRLGREILAATNPAVRMIWVNGCNIINQAPESGLLAKAFAATDFSVVVDSFMTDTAALADLVLPCALVFEKEDVVGSFLHNYVNYARPVVKPPETVRSDYWILSRLGARLDPPVHLPDAEDFIRRALQSPYLDTTLEELRRTGYARAMHPHIAFADTGFSHPDGRYHLPSELHHEPAAPEEFPLQLLSLVRRHFIHSQILPEEHRLPPTIWLAPDSPALAGVDTSRPLYLVSPLGRLRVTLKFRQGLHPQVVIYRRGDWMRLGGGINQLISSTVTDLGETAAFYSQYVRLENG